VVTAARAQNVERSLAELQARLAVDPEWNGGRYYESAGAKTIAPAVMSELAAAGVDARYFEIDSELGHSASGPEHAK
jgi:hypothetical protein